MGQHLRKISAFAIAAATTNFIAPQHTKSDDRSSAADCARVAACHGRHGDWAKTSQGFDIGNCQRGRSLRGAAGSGWLHDLDSRRAALPTGINEGIARPRGAPARSSADGDRHQRGFEIGQDQAGARFRPPCSSRLGLGLGHVARDRIHQGRRQAIIGFEPEFLQPSPDSVHLARLNTGLQHGRHERGKPRSC